MRIGKLLLGVLFTALPAVAAAQPGIDVNVGVTNDGGDDSYDTTAPGDPVDSVDVFYDQLSPYGVWVDEPDAGRVFIPQEDGFVPYTNGHWQYTSLGFVWVSSHPFGWATSHYGRWAYSNSYNRWVWAPDTQWGPAWVEWRQTGTHFGWAPLAPEGFVRVGYQAPIESWHYCGAGHILDANVNRFYEPRERVIAIQREARPIEHYSNVSNVRVVVGPPRSVLVAHQINVRPVRADVHVVGRWTPTEAHAQVVHAQEHKATFEVENQHRLQANVKINTVQAKVVETHPEIRARVDARVTVGAHPETHTAPPAHVENHAPPMHEAAPPAHVENHAPPAHTENHAPPLHEAAPPPHAAPPPAHVENHAPPMHEAAPPPHAAPPPAHTENHATPPPAHNNPPAKDKEHH